MPKKEFSAEQIVTLLRQIEVSITQGNGKFQLPVSKSPPDELFSTHRS